MSRTIKKKRRSLFRRRRRKRRSGNGTNARQWLYVLWNFPFVWVVKIGIAGDMKTRRRQVNRSNIGLDFPIWGLPIHYAYPLEQWLHRKLSFMRVKFFRGSGHTERFFFLAAFPAIFFSLLVFLAEWAFYFALAALLAAVLFKKTVG